MIYAPLLDAELEARLASLPPDGIVRFSLLGGSVKGALLSGTSMAASMRANHSLGILETIALAQAYVCAGLYSTTLKEGNSAGLRVDCTGPLRGFSVDATWDGRVRGYLFNPSIVLEKPLDSFDLKPFIGSGTFTVTRGDGRAAPFVGSVELVHGRIAEDLAEYFLRSEQARTAVAASVRLDKAGRVAGVGGLLLQAMPGASDVDVDDAEVRMRELPSLGDWFSQGRSRAELLQEWFAAFEVDVLAETPVAFSCDCSRERFAAFLARLSGGELDRMIEDGPHPAELVCHKCATSYLFDRNELQELRGPRKA